jgi:hypothetical protein
MDDRLERQHRHCIHIFGASISGLFLCLLRANLLLRSLANCARHCKPSEKQVAMIAQKVVDTKHTQNEQRRPITFSNS